MSNSITFPRGAGFKLTFCRFDTRTQVATITADGTDGHIAYAAGAPESFQLINDHARNRVIAWLGRASFELSAAEATKVAARFALTIEEIQA